MDMQTTTDMNQAMITDQSSMHDPEHMADEQAVLNLVSGSPTHVAINSGDWFDPNTWDTGEIPGEDAKVVIPDGVSVSYNGVSDDSLYWLRVDGELDFATDINTQLVIDTFVVSPDGVLTIGTSDNPVQDNVSAQILIADNGPIDTSWDPTQISRGLVSMGSVTMYGEVKDSHLKVAADPMQGDTTLVLESAPVGWEVGDSLVLTGTHYVPDEWNGSELVWQGTQDEELEIAAIDGNVITLTAPLQYDHDTPDPDLKAYVADYTRNIVIGTENADTVPNSQRGHVMFMHSDDVDVRYAEFYELGRTDKSEATNDTDNVKGRYPVHFHETGTYDDGDPAVIIGSSVWGSPGWGFAQHDSYVVMDHNAAYDVYGAAFVTETGNEIGSWTNNIAIKSEGNLELSKDGDRVSNQDIAQNGVGFWFQGRLVENENNVAAGQRHSGFTYMTRGEEQIDVTADNVNHDEITRYQDTIGPDEPPINGFENNEAFASGMGLEVIKANPNQEHDERSVLNGFTGWELSTGVHLEYTSKYTLQNFELYAAADDPDVGIEFGNNAFDMVVDGAYVEGFDTAVSYAKHHTFSDMQDWNFVLIDPTLVDNQTDYNNLDPAQDLIISQDDLSPGTLSFVPDQNADFVYSPDRNDRKVVISGTKTDSIGSVDYPNGSEVAEFDAESLANRLSQGYYVDANGTRFFTVEELFADRATGDLMTMEFVVVLTDDWTEYTLSGLLGQAPLLATYDGVVEPGPISSDLASWLDQYQPTQPTDPLGGNPDSSPDLGGMGDGTGSSSDHGATDQPLDPPGDGSNSDPVDPGPTDVGDPSTGDAPSDPMPDMAGDDSTGSDAPDDGSSHAVTITFENLDSGSLGTNVYQDPAGYSFSITEPFTDNLKVYGSDRGYDSQVLHSSNWGRTITLTQTDGGSFDLQSFDYGASVYNNPADGVVTGYFADGSTQTATFASDSKDLQTLVLGWDDLVQVAVDFEAGANQAYGALDNFVLVDSSDQDWELTPDTGSTLDPISTDGNGLTAHYYNDPNLQDLALTRTDSTVDFNWGSGSPDPIVAPDTFSVSWTGYVVPLYSEDYTFSTSSDDGIRLTIDDQLLIDNWTLHPATQDQGTITLEAGEAYPITLEYFEQGGHAIAELAWGSDSQMEQIVPQSQLFTVDPTGAMGG